MPTDATGKRLQALETRATEGTMGIFEDKENFARQKKLNEIDPTLKDSVGFLGGRPSPYANTLKYARTPGQMYANYPFDKPAVGGELKKPVPEPGKVPPPSEKRVVIPQTGSYEKGNPKPKLFIGKGMKGFEQENQRSEHQKELAHWEENKRRYYTGEPLQQKPNFPKFVDYIGKGMGGNKGAIANASAQYRKDMAAWEKSQQDGSSDQFSLSGQKSSAEPAVGSAGFDVDDYLTQLSLGNIGGMADGGIASLPVEMNLGGFLAAAGRGAMSAGQGIMGGIQSGAGAIANKIGTMADAGNQFRSNNPNLFPEAPGGGDGAGAPGDPPGVSGGVGKDATIAGLQAEISRLKQLLGKGSNLTVTAPSAAAEQKAAQGGLMSLADGDFVEYPRMNGQISGPGTERSDDIKAMLSDGEFVVNAKALRGIGKMDGANGDKEDQRMKGARMMYAMQQAGENQMRNS